MPRLPLSAPRARAGLVLVGLIVGTLALFHRVLPVGQTFLERDMLRVYLPAKVFWAEQVRQGDVPGWYPYNAFGQPFAGAMVTGAYHPTNLLFLLMEPVDALEVLVLLCFPLAGLGAWLSLRERGASTAASGVAAVGYAFGGYLVSMTNNLPYLLASATLPWVVWATQRLLARPSPAWAAAVGALLATVLLAGDPQAFAVTAGTVLVLTLLSPGGAPRRRLVAVGIGALGIAALLGSLQLVAAWSALSESFGEQRTLEGALTWSVHPLRLLDILLGNVFGAPGAQQELIAARVLSLGTGAFWASSLYVGLPTLLLAGVALLVSGRKRTTWVAGALACLFLLLMLGRHTPLYGLLYDVLPLWRPFRYPEKLFPHFAYWMLVLAATGLDALLALTREQRRLWPLGLLLAGGICAGLMLLSAGLADRLVGGTPQLDAETSASLAGLLADRLTVAALTSTALCWALGALWWFAQEGRALALGTLALVGLSTLTTTSAAYGVLPREVATQKPRMVEALEQRTGGPLPGRARTFSAVRALMPQEADGLAAEFLSAEGAKAGLFPDADALWGVESANWYLPAMTARSGNLLKEPRRWRRSLAALSNVRFVAVDARMLRPERPPANLVLSEAHLGVAVLQNAAVPRAYLAIPRCVAGPEESLAALEAPDFKPGRDAVVECREPLAASQGDASPGTIQPVEYAANHAIFDVEAAAPAVLVLSDAYASGWSATLDGAPATILPANHAFRAVPVPGGKHRIAFLYSPPGLTLGLGLTAAGLALCALAVVWERRRRAEPPAPSPL